MMHAARIIRHIFLVILGLLLWETHGFAAAETDNLLSEDGTIINLGKVRKGDRVTKKIRFKNTGKRRIHLLQGHITKGSFSFSGGKFPGLGGNCPQVLKPDQACEMVVSLSASAVGKKSAKLEFNHQERRFQHTTSIALTAEILPFLPKEIFLMYGYADKEKLTGNPKAPFITYENWNEKWDEVKNNFTVIEGLTQNAGMVNDLKARGKLFAYHVTATFPDGKKTMANDPCLKYLTKSLSAETAKDSDVPAGVNYLVCQWSKPFQDNLNGKLPGYFEAIMIDEFHSYPDGTSLSKIQVQALIKMRQKYPYKIIFASGVYRLGDGGEDSVRGDKKNAYDETLKAIRDNADIFVYENYQSTSNPQLDFFTSAPKNLQKRCPGLNEKTIFALGISQSPGLSYDKNPAVNFHSFLLKQLALVRQSYVDYKMMKGLGFWVFYRAKAKTIDWTNEMVLAF